MDNALQQFISNLNPSNTQTPILGSIRQFNQQTFGTPDYANPELSEEQRLMALVMSLGVKGGGSRQAAKQFGQALQKATPAWASNNLLNKLPSEVPGFYQSAANPRTLVSQSPSLNPQINPQSVNFQSVLDNARKLIRVRGGSK